MPPPSSRGGRSRFGRRRALLSCAALAGAGFAGWWIGHKGSPTPAHAPWGDAVALSALPDLDRDDLAGFLDAFRASCGHLNPAAPPGLAQICRQASALPPNAAAPEIRAFLATRFAPHRLSSAFFTGYYEPVVDASLVATPRFPTPLLARPANLVDIRAGSQPGLDPLLTAARRMDDGRLVAMPDRAAIETGALGAASAPVAFVASPLEAFFIQVQGSARLLLPDGRLRRLVYAGRNGYPYTAIGRILVARLGVPPAQMGMVQLKAWIREHGQGEGDEGTRLMRQNRSFIFFRLADAASPDTGPLGAEGVGLTATRSLAVDHAAWPYGLPFYIDTRSADGTPLRRLTVGQDTGAAIKGAARADIFFGTGEAAAARAGGQRAAGTLYALWPRADVRP